MHVKNGLNKSRLFHAPFFPFLSCIVFELRIIQTKLKGYLFTMKVIRLQNRAVITWVASGHLRSFIPVSVFHSSLLLSSPRSPQSPTSPHPTQISNSFWVGPIIEMFIEIQWNGKYRHRVLYAGGNSSHLCVEAGCTGRDGAMMGY